MSMAIRAYVNDNFQFGGTGVIIRVAIQDIGENGYPIRTNQILAYNPDHGNWRWRLRTDEEKSGSLIPTPDDTSINLPEGVGEAILEALARHFHGQASDLDLRADLRHERDRRDKAEDAFHCFADKVIGEIGTTARVFQYAKERPTS